MKIIKQMCWEKHTIMVKDGKLHFKSPQGAFGDELKQEVKANKRKNNRTFNHKGSQYSTK